jgi:hypothetical protein
LVLAAVAVALELSVLVVQVLLQVMAATVFHHQ